MMWTTSPIAGSTARAGPVAATVAAPPLVSIVVVNTNELHHLRECLPTLMAQTYPAYEVLLVDNGSTDGSLDYVGSCFPQVRIIANNSNLGYAGANNVGFKHARGDYIAVLNPDTIADPRWIEELVLALEAHPSAGLATPKIALASDPHYLNCCGNDITVTGLTLCRGLGAPTELYTQPEIIPAVSGAAFLIRRAVLEEIGGFDEDFFIYYEDTDLSLRAMLAGYDCLFVPTAVIRHKYVFKFSAQKCFFQERNRYYALLKTLRWRTILALLPTLLFAEGIVWAYVISRGPAHMRAKLAGYLWLVRNLRRVLRSRQRVQALRRRSDRALLERFGVQLTLAYTTSPGLARLAEALVNPVLRLLGGITRAVVAW